MVEGVINEFSCMEVMRLLRNTVFTTAQTFMKEYVDDTKSMQQLIEDAKDSYLSAFNTLFVKDFLIKLIAGLVKEPQQTYHDENEAPLDFSTLAPTPTFLSLATFLHDLLDSRSGQLDQALGLHMEKNVYLGLVVFKERLLLFILRRTLEVLRDVLIVLPLSSKS
jgi:hypothetical protein